MDIGLLSIDWKNRTVKVDGIHPEEAPLTAGEVYKKLMAVQENAVEHMELLAIVYWEDVGQLCLYDATELKDCVIDIHGEDAGA